MAPHQTTTLRVPTELRDEIARIAERRGSTMLEVVTDAVHRLSREEWWASVHASLDARSPSEAAASQEEVELWDRTASDGLDGR